MKRLALETVFEHSLLQQERAILLYALENREKYKGFASFITPSLRDWRQIWDRVRSLAWRVGVNTFLMQWLIWGYKRKQINDHAIFPGSHKV